MSSSEIGPSDSLFRAIVSRSFELMMVADGDGVVLWANDAFERVLGYPPASLIGTDIFPLFHSGDTPMLVETIARLSETPAVAIVDLRIRAADGAWHWMESSLQNMLADPDVGGHVVMMRDVTEGRRVRAALHTSEESLRDLIDNAHDVIYVATLDGRFTSINPAAERFTSYSRKELLEMSLTDLVAPEDVRRAREILVQRLAVNADEPFELQLQTKDGRRLFAAITARVVAPSGGPGRLEGVVRDVTKHHGLEEQLRRQASRDELTGLPNRVLLRDRLGQAVARSARDHSQIALLLVNLDDFKLVNDSIGHDAGDGVIVEAAARLRAVLGRGQTVARIGGDEFAILAEDVLHREVIDLAERIQSAFTTPFTVGTSRRHMTPSLGIALEASGKESAHDLLRDADTALRAVKASGKKGEIGFFDEALRTELLNSVALTEALKAALQRRELRVHYQPIVSLTDGHLVAAEALTRWLHPEWGWVEPTQFIPVAEEKGLIVPLGRHVIDEAARQLADWRRHYPRSLPDGVYINTSAREISQPDFTSFVNATLRERSLTPSDIALELTERVFIDDHNADIDRNLTRLTRDGVRIVLDDFGTGYSALSSLGKLPLAAVKIDRSFTGAITGHDDDTPITRAIVSLGHTFGLTVIAEGVENRTQLDYLRRIDCNEAQGFLLARPQPAGDISALIASAAPLA